ncbi:cytochrome b/b6 domain-containing protein [Halochromatium salexigens]|uniref:Cytochrome b n=1 Tax=Halochromatium salexigens TaxID=49447 RepID=A0AAJ0UE91_HALSE|nr:cytochrome b/b6 domain-containing protein [Halochromatium salexigens]MBK5929817.1 cytochrome b [Halochromatium salexigens]
MTRTVVMFTGLERLWHWSQALLIILLLLTGFEVHGSYSLLGFGTAATLHVLAALALIVVWIFAVFWHLATGEWRQYAPTTRGLAAVVRFYLYGMFRGESHPFNPRPKRKHNPLQAASYLLFGVVISPLLWITGLLYLGIDLWLAPAGLPLAPVALIHVAAAYGAALFLLVHVYMITTGRTPTTHLKTMITGREESDEAARQPSQAVPSQARRGL